MTDDRLLARPERPDAEPHDHLDPLVHVDIEDHPDALTEARAAAGAAVRDLGHALVGHDATLEELEEFTTTLRRLEAMLDTNTVRSRAAHHGRGDWREQAADGAVMTSFDERPISGRGAPWGLDLTVTREGDEVVGRCTLRAAHEGAPGRSHGGVVAALFDDVYGFVLALMAQPAFTGEISVRYVAGVPIGRPLECRARCVEQRGRKVIMTAELTDDGTVVATSTTTFIAIDPSVFAAGVTSETP